MAIFLSPFIFLINRHADPPSVVRRGIRPRGISIGTGPSDLIVEDRDRAPRLRKKDVDRTSVYFSLALDRQLDR